jgi:hypothetical protein
MGAENLVNLLQGLLRVLRRGWQAASMASEWPVTAGSLGLLMAVRVALQQVKLEQAALLQLPEVEYLIVVGVFADLPLDVGQQRGQRLPVLLVLFPHCHTAPIYSFNT